MHQKGSYTAIIVGLSVFFISMALLNYITFTGQNKTARFAKAACIAFIEAIVFIVVFLFLLLNTLGT